MKNELVVKIFTQYENFINDDPITLDYTIKTAKDANRQYMQCIGRSYRYGQKRKVHVKFFVTIGSIEEYIIKSFIY